MSESDSHSAVPAPPLAEAKGKWSSESVAIIGTGAAIIGVVVALFVATMSGFNSISTRLDDLNKYREDRLETVRQEQRRIIEDLQDSLDDSVGELEARIRAIEVKQANLEGKQG